MRRQGDVLPPEHPLVATGYFHETYLIEPKRVAPEKFKTVLCMPVEDVASEP